MLRRLGLLLTTSVAAAAVVLATLVAPAPALTPRATNSYVADVRAATNAERTERGMTALRGNPCLSRFAQRQAERIARAQVLSHTASLLTVLRRCGMSTVGENVAYHPGGGRAVVGAWMASPPHRANILTRGYRVLGVAAVRRHGTWWAVQIFGRRA